MTKSKQRLMLTPKVRSGLSGLTEIASTIALPKEHAAKRLPTYPNLERTSVLSLERNTTVQVGTTSVGYTRSAITRSPAAPLWVDQSVTQADYMGVSGLMPADVSVDDLNWYAFAPNMVLAYYGAHEYALAPSTVGVVYPLVGTVVGFDAIVTFEYGSGDGNWTQVQSNFTNAGDTQVDVPGGNWFRITRMEQLALGLNRFAFRVAATSRCLLPIGQPLELQNSVVPYESVRLTANACLYTNVTKVLNKEGTVLAARLTPSSDTAFPWNFDEADLSNVHPAERYYGALEHGAYSFTGASLEAVDFQRAWLPSTLLATYPDTIGATVSRGAFDLELCSTFNAYVFSDANTATAGDISDLAVTNTCHLEFRTKSSLFNTGFSVCTLESYHAAQLSLLQTGYFFENQIHWSQLASLILKGIRAAVPIVAPSFAAPVVAATRLGDAIVSRFSRKTDMQQKQMVKPAKNGRNRVRAKNRR